VKRVKQIFAEKAENAFQPNANVNPLLTKQKSTF